MLRNEWPFSYKAKDVREAAAAKLQHHAERGTFWSAELEKAIAKLRETGVDFREVEITGGQRTDLVVDPQLMARVNECRAKVKDHLQTQQSFARWERALASLGDLATLKLHVDDVHFFEL